MIFGKNGTFEKIGDAQKIWKNMKVNKNKTCEKFGGTLIFQTIMISGNTGHSKKSATYSESRPHIRRYMNAHIPSHINTYIPSHINARFRSHIHAHIQNLLKDHHNHVKANQNHINIYFEQSPPQKYKTTFDPVMCSPLFSGIYSATRRCATQGHWGIPSSPRKGAVS